MLKEAVYQKPVFEKVAQYELSKDTSKWNEEIIKHFFTEVSFIPRETGVSVVINHLDENKGYAKGSVVVYFANKQINYPIIVKDFELYPFDVMLVMIDGEPKYMNSTEQNIKRALTTENIGDLKNMYDGLIAGPVRSPGGIPPKSHVPLDNAFHDLIMQDQSTYNMRKLSSWKDTARKEDLEKLALQLKAQPDVASNFVDNTGDLINNVIQLAHGQTQQVPKSKAEMHIDINGVVKAKRAIVAIDSEFTDVNKLIPLKPPSVCELRTYCYPSMDDFMDTGASAIGRLLATKTGHAKAGILLPFKEYDDDCCYPSSPSLSSDKKDLRERLDQVFISACGHSYSIKRDYDKDGVLFYGSAVMDDVGLMPKMLQHIQDKNINDFHRDPVEDGSDKPVNHFANVNRDSYKAANSYGNSCCESSHRKSLFVIIGAGQLWECTRFDGVNKVWEVEGRKVYINDNRGFAIIPANVASIQRVHKVDGLKQPMYKMILGDKIHKVYLVPESAIVLSTRFMHEINEEDIMKPSRPIQQIFKEKAIARIDVSLGKEGIKVEGTPVKAFNKIAGIKDGTEMGAREAQAAMKAMGIDEARSAEIIKVAMDRGTVAVYGVCSDYINDNPFAGIEKSARVKDLLVKVAQNLRVDLVKEASELEDPEAVDVVLSLNFINEDNLGDYIDNIPTFQKNISKLCEILIASRMGLSDVDENACRKAIDGLEKVVEGLLKVKVALGK